MVKLENQTRGETKRSLFMMPYAGLLVVIPLTGERLTPAQQFAAAESLIESPDTNVRQATVEVDPDVPMHKFGLRLDAEGDLSAFEQMCRSVIRAWDEVGQESSLLEFMDVRLVYEPELAADQADDPEIQLDSRLYQPETMETIDAFDTVVNTPVQEIFYQVRAEIAGAD